MINGFSISAKAGAKPIKVNSDVKVVKGDDGFSPIVSLTKVNGVATLTITDKNGTQTVNIYDGDSGEIPEEVIANAVEDYLSKHPVPTLTEDDVKRIVAEYVTAHKSELKGDKGDAGYTPVKGVDYFDGQNGKDGANGKDGSNYVITANDYNAIADVVLTKLVSAESVSV